MSIVSICDWMVTGRPKKCAVAAGFPAGRPRPTTSEMAGSASVSDRYIGKAKMVYGAGLDPAVLWREVTLDNAWFSATKCGRCADAIGWCGWATGLLPQGGNQADYVDAKMLPTQRHAVLLRWGQTAPSAPGTGAGDVDVPGYLHRNLGQVDDLPSALGPTPRQLGSTVGTLLYHMLHPLGGRHANLGKAVATRLAWTFGLGWLPVGFGLQTRHPPGTVGFGLPFQLGNPLLQPFDDDLLPDDDANEDIAMVSPEIGFGIHASYMT